MDDQFNGRTDDDLFSDEIEPVASNSQPVAAVEQASPEGPPQPATESNPPPVATEIPAALPVPSAPRSLAQSRHADSAPSQAVEQAPKPSKQRRRRKQNTSKHEAADRPTEPRASNDSPAPSHDPAQTTAQDKDSTDKPDEQKPVQPKIAAPARAGPHASIADRLASGANPRTKLTDAQLADKMEAMRLASVERTRRFDKEQQDRQSHAIAYEKGMEETRKRRAEEAEKRKRGEEERRRMEDERNRNRERKLKAMGGRDGFGHWDEGKDDDGGDGARRGGFKGAHGGVRGVRGDAREVYGADEFRGRGRGGRAGRGRGRGRGGNLHGADAHHTTARPPAITPPKAEDFPALPGGDASKTDPTTAAMPPKPMAAAAALDNLASPSPMTPLGRWDDEMAALDDK